MAISAIMKIHIQMQSLQGCLARVDGTILSPQFAPEDSKVVVFWLESEHYEALMPAFLPNTPLTWDTHANRSDIALTCAGCHLRGGNRQVRVYGPGLEELCKAR